MAGILEYRYIYKSDVSGRKETARTCEIIEEVACALSDSGFENILRPSVYKVSMEPVADFISE